MLSEKCAKQRSKTERKGLVKVLDPRTNWEFRKVLLSISMGQVLSAHSGGPTLMAAVAMETIGRVIPYATRRPHNSPCEAR